MTGIYTYIILFINNISNAQIRKPNKEMRSQKERTEKKIRNKINYAYIYKFVPCTFPTEQGFSTSCCFGCVRLSFFFSSFSFLFLATTPRQYKKALVKRAGEQKKQSLPFTISIVQDVFCDNRHTPATHTHTPNLFFSVPYSSPLKKLKLKKKK